MPACEVTFAEASAITNLDADDSSGLSASDFAFPNQRKEPITNADHMRATTARANQIRSVTDKGSGTAWSCSSRPQGP